jgi:hypothetical protein
LINRSRKNTIYSCTLTSCAKRTYTHRPFSSPLSVSLLYSFKREKIPLLGSPEMSGKLRYECRLYLHPFTTPIAFWHPLFSLLSCRSREKTIHPHAIIPPFWEVQK